MKPRNLSTESFPSEELPTAPRDEYAGQGGSYEIVDGKRRLIERTRETPPRPGGRRKGDPRE